MSMSKKDFIALAEYLKREELEKYCTVAVGSTEREDSVNIPELLQHLANFCHSQNPRFMRDRWLAYIAGECRPNGGSVKAKHSVHRKGLYVADCTCSGCEVQREAILLSTKRSA